MFGIEYRPLTFREVIGLDVIKKVLVSNLKSKKFARGYIFEGSYSSGKTTISRIFARSILCNTPEEDFSPCNVCDSCIAFLNNIHPNYFEIDAANNGTKDKIQEIKELLKFDNIVGNSKRIILFDEAHNISKEGKDALLLQLEENDPNVILIFCTTESNKMPDTIKSRCYVFRLPEPTEKDVLDKLKFICKSKNIKYEEDALYKIVLSSGKHYRDAENKLSIVSSLFKDITPDNVKEVISIYDEEIVKLLLLLSDNLSGIIESTENLIAKMNVKDIYESIIRLLNDTIKISRGFIFGSKSYMEMLKKIFDKYGIIVYDLLDYFLDKKIVDGVFFQAYVLVLHYKLMKKEIGTDKKELKANKEETEKNKVKEEKIENKNKEDRKALFDDFSIDPWERADKEREEKSLIQRKEEPIEEIEKVSEVWKADIKTDVRRPKELKLTVEEFKQIFGGGNENK